MAFWERLSSKVSEAQLTSKLLNWIPQYYLTASILKDKHAHDFFLQENLRGETWEDFHTGEAGAVLQTALLLNDWFSHDMWKYVYSAATPQPLEMVLAVINRLVYNFFGNSKSWRTLKVHYWFKSYGNFAEEKQNNCSYWTKWWVCYQRGLPRLVWRFQQQTPEGYLHSQRPYNCFPLKIPWVVMHQGSRKQ